MRSIYFTIRLELPTELLIEQQLVTEEVDPDGGVWFRFIRPFRFAGMDPTPYGDGPWLATSTGNGVSDMYSLTVVVPNHHLLMR